MSMKKWRHQELKVAIMEERMTQIIPIINTLLTTIRNAGLLTPAQQQQMHTQLTSDTASTAAADAAARRSENEG